VGGGGFDGEGDIGGVKAVTGLMVKTGKPDHSLKKEVVFLKGGGERQKRAKGGMHGGGFYNHDVCRHTENV